jgi:hypothetical protein
MIDKHRVRDLVLLLLLAATAPLLTGYHFGFDDQAIWLPAIKKCLSPALYPFDSSFFLSQTWPSLFPELVAFSVSSSHLPLDLCVFLWHLLTIFLVLLGSWQLARLCFPTSAGQWAAVATIWAARMIPVGGTHLSLMDMYLHPRDLALGALLFAVVSVLKQSPRALTWVACAAVVHPTMAIFGAFYLAFLLWERPRKPWMIVLLASLGALAAAFLLRFFKPISDPTWWELARSRTYLFPLRWPWYAWLYSAVILAALASCARITREKNLSVAARLARRVTWAGGVGITGAILITTVPALNSFIRMDAGRVLHLAFFMAVFLGGGLMGEAVLHAKPIRWLLFLLPIAAIFFVFNRTLNSASPHVEWPGRLPRNTWVDGFDWIRRNTPRDALFALNPAYLTHLGADRHGFRAFAERSALADGAKDRNVAVLDMDLTSRWILEAQALQSWTSFDVENFVQLKKNFRVHWVVLERKHPKSVTVFASFSCPYENDAVFICQIP